MNSGQGVPFPVAKPPGLPVAPRPAAGSTMFFQETVGAKEAKVPPSSSPSLEAALQAARRVSKAQGQAGNSVAPFASQQQPSVAAGASEFVQTIVGKAPAGACMQAVVAPSLDPTVLMTRAHLESALAKLNAFGLPPEAAETAGIQSSPLAQTSTSLSPPEASAVVSQGLPSGPADLASIAAQLVDYENKVAVGEAMVAISKHKKRLRELEHEFNFHMDEVPTLHPSRNDGTFSAPVHMHELLTSSEPITDPATAAVAVRGLLFGGAYAEEPPAGSMLSASDGVGSSSDAALLPAAAHSRSSEAGPSCLAEERALVVVDQLPPLSPHRARAAHDGSVALKGIMNMAGTIVSTFADDRYPSHAAVLAALQDLPALQTWMYTVQPLKIILPQERVYNENGYLLFPSVDDFANQPATFVNMSKVECLEVLNSGGLFNFLGTPQPQVGVVPAGLIQKFKLVGNLRIKLALHAIDVAFVTALNSIAVAAGEHGNRLCVPLHGMLHGKRRQPASRPDAPPPMRDSLVLAAEAARQSARVASRKAGDEPYQPSPGMAVALAVSGVSLASVCPTAPRSTRVLLASFEQPFGASSYAVRQAARSLMALAPSPTALSSTSPPLTQEPPPPPVLPRHGSRGERRAERAEDSFEAAFADFLAVWPKQWLDHVLGGAEAAARTSERAANVAFRIHCVRHGGKGGLHLRKSVQLWKGELGYTSYRRAEGLPWELDFPIPPAEQVAFEAWRQRSSRAASGHTVVASVREQSIRAAAYFGYPLDKHTTLLCKAPKKVHVPGGAKPADPPPDEAILVMELEAAAGVSPASEYAAALAVMAWSRARLEDFATARELRIECMAGQQMLVGVMDMKDGSVAAWWCIAAEGLSGAWPWLPRWVDAVNARGYMFARYAAPAGDVFRAQCYQQAEADLGLVRMAYGSMLHRTEQRFPRVVVSVMSKPTCHGPRHWCPVWARLFMWSLPAREELGRWLGDMEIILLPGEVRHTKQRASRDICAVRYAADAARALQARLAVDLLHAIRAVLPRDEYVMDRIVGSAHYKLH